MLNFYITAVKYGILTIDKVPAVYQDQVRDALGMNQQENSATNPDATM
ncbi:hypothetical protein [Bacillus smithii]